MNYNLPLLLLSAITSTTLSGVFEIKAEASVTPQTSNFPTNSVRVDKTNPSTTYTLSRKSTLKIASQIENSEVLKPKLRAEIPEGSKIFTTPTLDSPLAELLIESSQPSPDQNSYLSEVVVNATSLASKNRVERQASTISEANLPPIATTQHSAALLKQPETIQLEETEIFAQSSEEEQFPPAEEVVPDDIDEVDPGRPTRSGTSYIGIGANFGVGGDTSLGDSGLFLYSKVGLTRYFSIRPAMNTDFDEDATFLLPLTFDLAPIAVGETGVSIAPYFGGGPAVSTTGDFGPVISGGIDMPLTERLTATSGVNIGILDEADVGVFVGIGYTFPSLF